MVFGMPIDKANSLMMLSFDKVLRLASLFNDSFTATRSLKSIFIVDILRLRDASKKYLAQGEISYAGYEDIEKNREMSRL